MEHGTYQKGWCTLLNTSKFGDFMVLYMVWNVGPVAIVGLVSTDKQVQDYNYKHCLGHGSMILWHTGTYVYV